jgi:peptidoglycan-associated lipoprotein
MMKNNRFFLLGVIVLIGMFALWGCPKKSQVTSSPDNMKGTAPSGESAPGPGAGESKDELAAKQRAKEEAMERAATAAAGLQPVYFDFDRSSIREDARAAMTVNAQWLKANPAVKVRIEGNSDERGTREYNQALGQRRAASAKKYIVDMGISAKRISLISYGKEKPVCGESSEGCWQKNRRDDFIAVTQ